LFTGTPPGVGPLNPGDAVTCEIEGVARLEFRMADS
jgi:2-keto-4-pentenoate hydratase/2-oxohepta-3-ene-1,7-dioic acid hydratase in catechol pathway